MTDRTRCSLLPILVLLASTFFDIPLQAADDQRGSREPVIEVVKIPPSGGGPHRMEVISGKATAADLSAYQILVFARTDKWYVQPFVTAPFTAIRADGSWSTKTHLGVEYAVLLVGSGYVPPATAHSLPTIGGDVVAIVQVVAGP